MRARELAANQEFKVRVHAAAPMVITCNASEITNLIRIFWIGVMRGQYADLQDWHVEGGLQLVQGGGSEGGGAAADEAQRRRAVRWVVLFCPREQYLHRQRVQISVLQGRGILAT